MQGDVRLQARRYEYKYLIDEGTAREVRRFVRMYLQPDGFTDPHTCAGYPVHSLYLDSPDLQLCRQTICGEKNRYKLRIRFYDDSPSNPVFLEVKRRTYDTIQKQRVAMRRSSLPSLLEGKPPKRSDLVRSNEGNYRTLTAYCELINRIRARPAAYTSYEREAYEPPDHNFCRVTFDRNIRAGEFKRSLSTANLDEWPLAPIDGVVLELKFTDLFPEWMHKLAQLFDLQRISVPKYVECMNTIERASARRRETSPRIVVDCPLRIVAQTSE